MFVGILIIASCLKFGLLGSFAGFGALAVIFFSAFQGCLPGLDAIAPCMPTV